MIRIEKQKEKYRHKKTKFVKKALLNRFLSAYTCNISMKGREIRIQNLHQGRLRGIIYKNYIITKSSIMILKSEQMEGYYVYGSCGHR